jgi:hypothetical protein
MYLNYEEKSHIDPETVLWNALRTVADQDDAEDDMQFGWEGIDETAPPVNAARQRK